MEENSGGLRTSAMMKDEDEGNDKDEGDFADHRGSSLKACCLEDSARPQPA